MVEALQNLEPLNLDACSYQIYRRILFGKTLCTSMKAVQESGASAAESLGTDSTTPNIHKIFNEMME